MPKQPSKKELLKAFFIPIAVLVILTLATLNLQVYLSGSSQNQVLAETTSLEKEGKFWEGFLSQNPTYIPGWIEYAKINLKLDNPEKVERAEKNIKNLDPNYEFELEEYLD